MKNSSYSWPRRRVRPQKVFKAASLTRQSELEGSDINIIYRKYVATGYLPEKRGTFGDVANIDSLQDALFIAQNAHDAFADLPAHIRDKFNNDPVQAMQFMTKPDNFDEAVRLGLISPRKLPDPVPAPVEGRTAKAVHKEPVKSGSKPQKAGTQQQNDDSNDE